MGKTIVEKIMAKACRKAGYLPGVPWNSGLRYLYSNRAAISVHLILENTRGLAEQVFWDPKKC